MIRNDWDYEHPPSFEEELNRQCNALVLPGALISLVCWIFYIPLDKNLYAASPLIIYLRMGLSLVAFVCLALHYVPYFKSKGYLLLFIIFHYMEYAAAIIVALTAADPIYMGGLSIVILVIGFLPFQRRHAFFLLLSTLILFFTLGSFQHISFHFSWELYGLYNLLVAAVVSAVAIVVYDRIRRNGYEKSLLVRQTNLELKNANKVKSELLEIAAHDLKDPLQVIIGYADLLKMKYADDSFAVEKLYKIYKSTDQMIRLITGLLEFASIESGKLLINRSDIVLSEMAAAVIKNNLPNAERKKQELIFDVENDGVVSGDRIFLQQVLENIIGNAIKFSPQGKPIYVRVCHKSPWGVIRVKDEGPGLSEEDKRKLFKKFQRLSAKPTGDESSTGLGLALSKEFVELHGGNLRVESQWGEGSEFIVEIPIQAPSRK